MKLLAFETATEACSVAVSVDGQVLERFALAPRRHAELALPWAQALLAEAGLARAQLDAIAVSRGPGAFTGVRLGIGIAQGIALGLDRPVVAVSTLAVLAATGAAAASADADAAGQNVLAAIDARMGEVYLGTFDCRDGAALALGPEVVVRPQDAEIPAGAAWRGVGTGFAAADAALSIRLAAVLTHVDAQALPRAGVLARLAAGLFARGGGEAPERVEPAYLRNRVALTLDEQRRLRGA